MRINSYNTNSYNAGYHRGLNTEYHDRDPSELFSEWRAASEHLLVPIIFDEEAFEHGYEDGLADYTDLNAQQEFASTTAGWEPRCNKSNDLYEQVKARVSKLKDDTDSALAFADISEDDQGTEMIFEFIADITKILDIHKPNG